MVNLLNSRNIRQRSLLQVNISCLYIVIGSYIITYSIMYVSCISFKWRVIHNQRTTSISSTTTTKRFVTRFTFLHANTCFFYTRDGNSRKERPTCSVFCVFWSFYHGHTIHDEKIVHKTKLSFPFIKSFH